MLREASAPSTGQQVAVGDDVADAHATMLPDMRVATFNLLHGRSLRDGRVDADRLAEAARALDADILCLQEVDRHQPRSHHLDETAVMAEAMGAVDQRFAAAMTGVAGEGWRRAFHESSGPAYGVAIASRLPVARWHRVALRGAPVRAPVAHPGTRRMLLIPDEPRVGLAAEIEGSRGPVVVATTHLSFVPGWNLWQLWRLQAELEDVAGGRLPVLLAGDLNLPGRAAGLSRPGWRLLARAPTWPVEAPRWQFDHVLARGTVEATRDVETRDLGLSDHRALVMELGV